MSLAAAKAVGAKKIDDLKEFVSKCDVVTVNCPLHEGTRGLVNTELLKHFKKVTPIRAYIRESCSYLSYEFLRVLG